jgi:2-desacetyl-2-hydroxyethyl bacteriochlorophyllide A dehydrogenase
MKNMYVSFEKPHTVRVKSETVPTLESGQTLVKTVVSAVSAGTELLLYSGNAPTAAADGIDAISSGMKFPMKYGYSAVGEIIDTGKGVDKKKIGQHVFAFNPHESHFIQDAENLIPLPEGIEPEDAVFLANMETAVSLLQDGKPLLGERVAIIGQGVVGLLTTALGAYFPLAALVSIDNIATRREASMSLGAYTSYSPDALPNDTDSTFDLVFELSGNPAAIDTAIRLAGYAGRVIMGSWYGGKSAPIALGGRFHHERIRLISSQVSAIAPELSGRWDKRRRFALAWEMLKRIKPSRLVTGRFPIIEAPQLYEMLASDPQGHIQMLFTYPH